MKACNTCQATLTSEEEYYYDGRCEDCIQEENERLTAWRRGADDPYFDKVFGLPEVVVH